MMTKVWPRVVTVQVELSRLTRFSGRRTDWMWGMTKREDPRMSSKLLVWVTDGLWFKSPRKKKWEEEQTQSGRNT